MSRYFALILLPDTLTEPETSNRLLTILNLYNANSYGVFEPFRIPCECTLSDHQAILSANQAVAPVPVLWLKYQNDPAPDKPSWRTLIEKWEQIALEASCTHPNYQPPDPACDLCHGEGSYLTDAPPIRTHDYWSIDGGLDVKFDSPHVWPTSTPPGDLVSLRIGVLITPDGHWYEPAAGWWADQNEAWLRVLSDQIAAHPHHHAVRVVLHR